MSDFLKLNIKSLAPKWMVQALKASSFASENFVVRILAVIPFVLTEIAFSLIYSRQNLGRGIGSYEM